MRVEKKRESGTRKWNEAVDKEEVDKEVDEEVKEKVKEKVKEEVKEEVKEASVNE